MYLPPSSCRERKLVSVIWHWVLTGVAESTGTALHPGTVSYLKISQEKRSIKRSLGVSFQKLLGTEFLCRLLSGMRGCRQVCRAVPKMLLGTHGGLLAPRIKELNFLKVQILY